MKSSVGSALFQALALLRAPRGARPGPDEPLPDGILLLLRLVAGEEQALAIAQESTHEPADTLREAAGFYIQQVMFAAECSSYRVLGVDHDVVDERLREHYRWLARWLHPDRNPDKWEAVYAERVNQAWQDLRTPERRQHYDQKLRESTESPRVEPREPLVVVRRGEFMEPAAPGWNLRWVPTAIFGGLGVSAILIVSLFYALRWAEPGPERVRAQQPMAEVSPTLKASPAANEEARTGLAVPVLDVNLRPSIAAAGNTESESAFPATTASFKSAETSMAAVAPAMVRPAALSEVPNLSTKAAESSPSPPVRKAHVRGPAPQSTTKVPALSVASAPAKSGSESEPVIIAPRAPRKDAEQARVKVPVAETPLATGEPIPPSVSTSPSMDERDANRLLGHFSRAYAEGNLAGMRAMFTNDATGPRGGLDKILAEYDRLFASSQERSLAVRDVSLFADGATLTIIASYQATVTTGRSRRQRRTHGDLRLDLRREAEQWRIYRLQHDDRPG